MRVFAPDQRKKTGRVCVLAAAVVAATMFGGTSVMFGGTPVVLAQDITCTGTVGGGSTVTTINGNVTVPASGSCTLDFVNVAGNIHVQHGGSLLITGYREPSTIGGFVQADNCASTRLEGNVTVDGDVQIGNCSGPAASGFQGPGI